MIKKQTNYTYKKKYKLVEVLQNIKNKMKKGPELSCKNSKILILLPNSLHLVVKRGDQMIQNLNVLNVCCDYDIWAISSPPKSSRIRDN